MIPKELFLCLLGLVGFGASNIDPVDRGYVFTAPKKLLAGETESGCLSLHNLEGPAHILLELLSPSSGTSDEEVLASTSSLLETGVETCLELAVPEHTPTAHSIARLRLKIRFDKYPEYHVNTEKEVYIEHDSVITFVETDKPVYKPGQDVRVRVLALTHDLKPWKRAIPKIWIENPSEVRVAQWTNLSMDRGMVQLTFPLSPEPSPGNWRIKVEKKRSLPQLIHTSSFEVRKYVLPRFQVTINPPRYILADADNVTWTVCASYSYGKPVRGTLLLKSTPQTPSWRRKLNLPEIYNEIKLTTDDGCTKFTVTGTELGLAHWKVAPTSIVLNANLTEAGTEVVETATSRTVVVHQALKLEFAPHTPKYFKLGLPYHGKLRVLRQDQTPAVGEKIQLCLRVRGKDEWVRVVVECRNFTSSVGGFVNFIVPPQHKNIVLLSFVATAIEYPTKYYSPDKRWRVFMDQPSAYIDVGAWYSPSESYLAVARGYQPIVCGDKYPFNVMYTMPAPGGKIANQSIAFHYSISSKGDLLIFGHVKHKPHQDSLLNYSEFRNVLGAVEVSSNNKSEHSSVVHRFPLSVKVTPSMAPVSELLLYYVRSDGETVATTYTIEVGHCFENKVKTSWHEDTQTPGGTTRYHVEAAPWSLCGVSVLDKSTLFLARSQSSNNKGSNLLDADRAFERVKRFHLDADTPLYQSVWSHCEKSTQPETSIEEIDHLPSPAVEAPPVWDLVRDRRARRKRQSGLGAATVAVGGTWVNYVDAMQAFDDFGVVVMSDLIVESRPCPQHPWMTSRESIDFRMMRRGMDEPDRIWMAAKSMPQAFPLLNGHEMGYVDHLTDHASATLRSYFPETWLWELVPTGKDGRATIKRNLPHTITDWIGHTVCVSPNYGLGIAAPAKLTAFQPFFLDYALPYSVKRGELLRMKVSLFNYMDHSLPVKITLLDTSDFDLQLARTSASYCVESRTSVVHEYPLRARVIGEINVTVTAAVDPDYEKPCGPEILLNTRDSIVKPILVQPEGFPVETTKTAFMCPKHFEDDDTLVAWNLDLPKDSLVPDSARGYVSVVGDLLGPALENLENLVRLPFGCGEQNLILFTPNIHVIGYLEATRRNNPDLRSRAIRSVEKGYQRELNYRHPDGSYSAFGPHSSENGGSMWLTAFVVKSFAQARSLIHVDERDLKLSVKWIVKKQLENGCFPLIGRIFHKDMKGGLQDDQETYPSALTAYVLISLLESGVSLAPSLISNALYCLEKGMAASEKDGNPYTATLSTYALALLEHPNANASMKSLLDRSTRLHDLLWWEVKSKPSKGLSIEMTAYAVLSLVKLGGEANMALALKAVRWMARQRNAEGGFTSTQDTVLGLEALAKYAAAMSTNSTDLSILVIAGEVAKVFGMNDENRMVLTQVRLPSLPTNIQILVEGEGCVLVQTNLRYNVANATGSDAFDLTINSEPVLSGGECSMQKITLCSRYKMADEESNMALLEIGMISGYVPDKPSLHALLEEPNTKVKRFEEDRGNVVVYFDKLTSEKTCISFLLLRANVVEQPRPANVKLYDYYQPELVVTQSYMFSWNCGVIDDAIETARPGDRAADDGTNDTAIDGLAAVTIVNEPDTKKSASTSTTPSRREITQLSSRGTSEASEIERSALVSSKSATGSPSRDNRGNGDRKSLRDDRSRFVSKTATMTSSSSTIDPTTSLHRKIGDFPPNPSETLESRSLAMIDVDTVDAEIRGSETGSGHEASPLDFDGHDSAGFVGNPAFVIIDHELENPDGIEGPPPVYVKPSYNFNFAKESRIGNDEDRQFFSNNAAVSVTGPRSATSSEGSDLTTVSKQGIDVASNSTASICPICGEKIFGDVKNIYCTSRSFFKVLIRSRRRVKILDDLRVPDGPKRFRVSLKLSLDSRCVCPALDKSGSLALLVIRSDLGDRFGGTTLLDGSYSIYGLPDVGWSTIPPEIIDAQHSCPLSDKL